MISVAVNALPRLETIVPAVKDLGKRHASYSVLARTMKDAAAES